MECFAVLAHAHGHTRPAWRPAPVYRIYSSSTANERPGCRLQSRLEDRDGTRGCVGARRYSTTAVASLVFYLYSCLNFVYASRAKVAFAIAYKPGRITAVFIDNMSDSPSSPAALIESATATNPNTQLSGELAVNDSETDNQNNVSGDKAAINAAPLLSSLSRRQVYDIQPTWADIIDQTQISACACWHPDQKIDKLSFDIHWSERHAFLRLSIRLRLKAAPDSSRYVRRNAYILIYPERIDKLLFIAQPDSTPFLGSTRAFNFYFNRPPALILPKTHVSFLQEAEDIICSLKSLVQQSCLTIYANLPKSRLSKAWLQQFCEDITKRKFTTISSRSNWKTLYRSQGGEAEAIEGDSLLEPVINLDDTAASGLPVYQEIEKSILTRPTKRKRPCDDSSAIEPTVQDIANVETLIGNVLDAKLAAHERKLEEMYSARKRELKEMHSAHERAVEEMLSTHRHEVEEILSTHRREVEWMEDGLTERIDKEIKDGLDEVQEYVLETITSMPIQATITFPTHPTF
ncbi:hypothetical protein V8C37DRAFT_380292 [Trichoderma ceciliae]